MAVTTRVLRRGLEIFAGISLVGFIGLLLYGNNMDLFLDTMVSLKWGWLALGVLLASLDWLGGGIRIWILLRHLTERASLQGSILASGLSAWGAAVTPSQTGGGPMIIYTLHRYGTPVPEAMIVALMSFVATVIFYAIAGPTAIMLGAGRSLEAHGVLGQSVTLYDLFRLSLGGFIAIGVAMLFLFIFPGVVKRAAQSLVGWLEDRGSDRLAQRIRGVNSGIERSHECMVAFFKGWGWAALGAAVIVSAAAFANRLLAGYVILRILDIQAPFVDVLLLQTLITFLLYFAPTPGGSGIAEVLSAAVMSIYVPRELTPSYILLWRIVVSYLTVVFGSLVFWYWLKGSEDKVKEITEEIEIPGGLSGVR